VAEILACFAAPLLWLRIRTRRSRTSLWSIVRIICSVVATRLSRTTTLPFDRITGAQIDTGFCLDMFGLAAVSLQTAGSQNAEEVIYNLADPAGFRERVFEARRIYRDGDACDGTGGSSGAPTQSNRPPAPMVHTMTEVSASSRVPDDPIARIDYVDRLQKLGVLATQEADEARDKIFNTDRFADAKQNLIERLIVWEKVTVFDSISRN
jgi:Bacterial PH domain